MGGGESTLPFPEIVPSMLFNRRFEDQIGTLKTRAWNYHAFTYIGSVRFSFKYLFQQRIFGTQFFFERMMDEKLSPIHRIPFDHIGCSEMV